MEEHENSCAFLVHDTTRLIRKRLDQATREVGLSPAKWRMLSLVERRPGISQSDLADELEIEKAPAGLTLEALQQAGLVRRELSPDDRRVRRVFLCEQAADTLAAMYARHRALEVSYLRGFDEEETAQLLGYLRTIRDALQMRDASSTSPPENFLGLLFDCERLLTQRFDARLREFGYTRQQWLVLNTVFRNEGMRQTEIAGITAIDAAPVGKIVDALEKVGWLERRNDTEDRRAKRLFVTRRAKHMLTSMRVRFEELHAAVVTPLGDEGTRVLISRLDWIRYRLLEESASEAKRQRGTITPAPRESHA